jgi:hypothetical protein
VGRMRSLGCELAAGPHSASRALRAFSRPRLVPCDDPYMQFALQFGNPEIGSAKPFSGDRRVLHARAPAVHPRARIPCEHMFPSLRTFALAQQALAAFRLTRSFLMLEDDDRVDWEVDRSEPADASPDRAPLREGIYPLPPARRRAGQPPPALHACLCSLSPVGWSAPRRPTRSRDRIHHRPLSSRHLDSHAPCAGDTPPRALLVDRRGQGCASLPMQQTH